MKCRRSLLLSLIAVDFLLQFLFISNLMHTSVMSYCVWTIFQSTSISMTYVWTIMDLQLSKTQFQSLCHEVLRVLPRTQVTCLLGGVFFSHRRCCTPKTVAGYHRYTVHYSSNTEKDCEFFLSHKKPCFFQYAIWRLDIRLHYLERSTLYSKTSNNSRKQ